MKTSNHKEIDAMLREQNFGEDAERPDMAYLYAGSLSMIEKSTVVVSDLKVGTSRIFHGKFSEILGLKKEEIENSIWEKEILNLMTDEQRDKKYISELRFFNFLRHLPSAKRENYYLASHLKMRDKVGNIVDVLHRMYYIYEKPSDPAKYSGGKKNPDTEKVSDTVRLGICIYEPLVFLLPSESVAIDSLSGKWIELSSKNDGDILSVREKQVLSLIEKGLTSQNIATQLCISKHTVSRHRQEILAKLQVKNSTEACLRAKQLQII